MSISRYSVAFVAVLASMLQLEGSPAVDEFRDLVSGSSRVEIRSRDQNWEQYGLPKVRKVFDGEAEVRQFVSAIEFQSQDGRVAEPGTEAVPLSNCGCDGHYEIVFLRGEQVVVLFTFHHGTHIRCPRFNDGRDAYLSDQTKAFLRQLADIEADVEKAQEADRRKQAEANKALQTSRL